MSSNAAITINDLPVEIIVHLFDTVLRGNDSHSLRMLILTSPYLRDVYRKNASFILGRFSSRFSQLDLPILIGTLSKLIHLSTLPIVVYLHEQQVAPWDRDPYYPVTSTECLSDTYPTLPSLARYFPAAVWSEAYSTMSDYAITSSCKHRATCIGCARFTSNLALEITALAACPANLPLEVLVKLDQLNSLFAEAAAGRDAGNTDTWLRVMVRQVLGLQILPWGEGELAALARPSPFLGLWPRRVEIPDWGREQFSDLVEVLQFLGNDVLRPWFARKGK